MSASYGITTKKYHTDNGIFRTNDWVQHCQERANTKLTTYDELDDHHTNNLAYSRIRDIQDNGRAMMPHAQQKLPEAITDNLWPYALRHANNAYNTTPLLAHPQELSYLQLFIGTQVQDNPKHWHTFGWPSYVLNEDLCSS